MRKPEKFQKTIPEPYFEVNFACSNRAFYEVKSDLYELAKSIDIEIEDGYIGEKCDYEGDLETIIIYECERSRKLIDAVSKMYGIDAKKMDIHLSCY